MGINVQKGQMIVVSCPVDCAPFGRQLARAAYDAGAKDVVMSWTDDFCAREHWLRADDSLFDAVYPWDALRSEQLAREEAGFISVSGSDPENLRGVDPDRLRRYSAATGRDLRTYYRMMTSSAIAWCVVSVPTAAWARKVFPGRTDDEAMGLLWEKILAAVRIAPDTDAVAAWQAHCAALEALVGKMVTVKTPEGKMVSGCLSVLAATADGGFYTTYQFDVEQADVEEVVTIDS